MVPAAGCRRVDFPQERENGVLSELLELPRVSAALSCRNRYQTSHRLYRACYLRTCGVTPHFTCCFAEDRSLAWSLERPPSQQPGYFCLMNPDSSGKSDALSSICFFFIVVFRTLSRRTVDSFHLPRVRISKQERLQDYIDAMKAKSTQSLAAPAAWD